MKKIFLIIALLATFSCTPKTSVEKPVDIPAPTESPKQEVPVTPVKTMWPKDEYRVAALAAASPLVSVVPKDVKNFCPNYEALSQADRKAFYAELMAAMVKFESNFKNEEKYTENFKDNTGHFVVSRGLFQISLESSQAYKCGFKKAEDIHEPLANIACAGNILGRWIPQDGYIGSQVGGKWMGGARYWSTLRSSGGPYSKITAITKDLQICKAK